MYIDTLIIITLAAIAALVVIYVVSSVYDKLEDEQRPQENGVSAADIVEMLAKGDLEEAKQATLRLTPVTREERQRQIEDAIADARARGLYDYAEHLTSELEIWKTEEK